jgi:hypothetical protein
MEITLSIPAQPKCESEFQDWQFCSIRMIGRTVGCFSSAGGYCICTRAKFSIATRTRRTQERHRNLQAVAILVNQASPPDNHLQHSATRWPISKVSTRQTESHPFEESSTSSPPALQYRRRSTSTPRSFHSSVFPSVATSRQSTKYSPR